MCSWDSMSKLKKPFPVAKQESFLARIGFTIQNNTTRSHLAKGSLSPVFFEKHNILANIMLNIFN
jgi:hypothetical protein